MKMRKIYYFLISVLLVTISLGCNKLSHSEKKPSYEIGYAYDARMFLLKTQIASFNKIYPDFDEKKAEKDWEWKDVDPIGLFTPSDNRKRRRENFLYEYSSTAMLASDRTPTQEQEVFRTVVQKRISDMQVIMSSQHDVKLIIPYKIIYENLPEDSLKNLLELVSDLGLQWAGLGGNSLYLYNGTILLAKYESGDVYLADLNIDSPRNFTEENKKE